LLVVTARCTAHTHRIHSTHNRLSTHSVYSICHAACGSFALLKQKLRFPHTAQHSTHRARHKAPQRALETQTHTAGAAHSIQHAQHTKGTMHSTKCLTENTDTCSRGSTQHTACTAVKRHNTQHHSPDRNYRCTQHSTAHSTQHAHRTGTAYTVPQPWQETRMHTAQHST
jgi:hypothetical protein